MDTLDDNTIMDHYYDLVDKGIFTLEALQRRLVSRENQYVPFLEERVSFLTRMSNIELMTDDEKYHHDTGRYYDDDWGHFEDEGPTCNESDSDENEDEFFF